MDNAVPTTTHTLFGETTTHTMPADWSWPLRLSLIGSLIIAAGAITIVATVSARQKSATRAMTELVAYTGLSEIVRNKLDARYNDWDGNLIADPPMMPETLVDPDILVLSHYMGDDEGTLRVDWEALKNSLSEAVSRPVQLQPYLNTASEIAAVGAGEIHVVAAHSAEIPVLVNTAGLVPFAELGNKEAADGNRLVIAVAPDSTILSLAELCNDVLVCTEPDSITGYRAAIVSIWAEAGLKPNIDYEIYYSHKHERSIRGLMIGKFRFVALSNDVLERMITEGQVEESAVRILHESQPIPRLTVGHVHNLQSELAAKVTQAILEFQNNDEIRNGNETLRFMPIDYQMDYDFVRRLDDAFEPRFGQIFSLDTGS